MKFGLMLPQARQTTDPGTRIGIRAEAEGVDGLFAFDHLWLPGQPDKTALSPFALLAAVAMSTRSITLGTLIARVDTQPITVLVEQFCALRSLAGDRIIAGLVPVIV